MSADAPRLRIEEDTEKPPGHARLLVSGVAASADPRFRLRRVGAEPDHLGPHGWQNSPALLEADAVREEAGATVFEVGPAVVDRLSADVRVELELPALGLTLTGYWPDIAPSAGSASGATVFGPTRTAEPPPAPPRAEAPAAQPEAAVAAVEPTPEQRPEPPPVPPPAPEPTPAVERDTTGHAPMAPPAWRRWVPAGVAALLLLIVGAGAYWSGLLDGWLAPASVVGDRPAEPTPVPVVRTEPPDSGETAGPVAPRPPEPVPVPPPEPARDWRAELLDYVRGTPEPAAERLFELGEGAAGAGDLETALLAYEEAVKRNDGAALRAIGRWYDPLHFAPDRSPFSRANPEQAARYYERAAQAGAAEAAEDLRALCQHLADAGEQAAVEQCAAGG